jgi:hypothetical protein
LVLKWNDCLAMPFASTFVGHRTISSILGVLSLSWYTNVVHTVLLAWRYAGLAWHRQPDWSESGRDGRPTKALTVEVVSNATRARARVATLPRVTVEEQHAR